MKTVFVTGAAGFIGYHLSERLLKDGVRVVGFDNLNDYYSVALKEARLERLTRHANFSFVRDHLENKSVLVDLFQKHDFSTVFHLAAQAGVRYSLEKPEVYLRSNIDGTLNILEAARFSKSKPHLLMASSSSVYGTSTRYPFREDDPANHPVALYGATKRSNELMAHSYSHLFGLRTTMLRFFTVYGPWGRPDMALFLFTKNIIADKPIDVFNSGDMIRDFTYVADIVEGMIGLEQSRLTDAQPLHDVFNIGCAEPRTLMEFVHAIEKAVGKKAKLNKMPFQPGDVYKTIADVGKISTLCGYKPKVSIEQGVEQFVRWYQEFYK